MFLRGKIFSEVNVISETSVCKKKKLKKNKVFLLWYLSTGKEWFEKIESWQQVAPLFQKR